MRGGLCVFFLVLSSPKPFPTPLCKTTQQSTRTPSVSDRANLKPKRGVGQQQRTQDGGREKFTLSQNRFTVHLPSRSSHTPFLVLPLRYGSNKAANGATSSRSTTAALSNSFCRTPAVERSTVRPRS